MGLVSLFMASIGLVLCIVSLRKEITTGKHFSSVFSLIVVIFLLCCLIIASAAGSELQHLVSGLLGWEE
jgi:hypothetical protein